jgi:hypothetical protein
LNKSTLLAVTLPWLAAASFTGPTILTGSAPGDYFGTRVAHAGDVDGDGYPDLLVGAGNSTDGRADVYLYLGGPTGIASTPAVTWTGDPAERYFGTVLAGGGDVNGDGYTDVLIGSPGESRSTIIGSVRLYLGGPAGPPTVADRTWLGSGGFDEFGTSVAFAGDLNTDGYDDIVLGSPGSASGFGYVNVHLGSASGPADAPDITWTGEVVYDGFGQGVAGAGDVDGDGYDDVVIGADGYDSYTGRALVYLGGAAGPAATPATTVVGEYPFDQFGLSVAGVGDLDGDGYDDIVIGAPFATTFEGRAYVYMGSAAGVAASPVMTWSGTAAYGAFGVSLAGVGDVDADGHADIVIGAYGEASSTGAAYLYTGSAGGVSATAAVTWTGETVESYFGCSVAGLGDLTGDGYDDLAIGAVNYDAYTGRVYVYEGAAEDTGDTGDTGDTDDTDVDTDDTDVDTDDTDVDTDDTDVDTDDTDDTDVDTDDTDVDTDDTDVDTDDTDVDTADTGEVDPGDKDDGCGCATGNERAAGSLAGLLAVMVGLRRRRGGVTSR